MCSQDAEGRPARSAKGSSCREQQLDSHPGSDGWRPMLHGLGEFDEHLEPNPDKKQEAKGLSSLLLLFARTSSLLPPPSITSHQLSNRNCPLSPTAAVQLRKRSEPAFPCTCSAIKFPTCVSPAPMLRAAGTIEQRGPKSTRLTLNSNGP